MFKIHRIPITSYNNEFSGSLYPWMIAPMRGGVRAWASRDLFILYVTGGWIGSGIFQDDRLEVSINVSPI